MPFILQCRCGKTKEITNYAHEHGQRYCSMECARRFRVYTTKPETLNAKVTVTMTTAQRKTLEQRAQIEDISITDLARQYIVQGLSE